MSPALAQMVANGDSPERATATSEESLNIMQPESTW